MDLDNHKHAGHRKRVKDRYTHIEIRQLQDYEILEMLLFYAIPRADTKILAKLLLQEYGSIAAVINAPADKIKSMDGIGCAVVHLFKLMQDLHSRIILPVYGAKKSVEILNDWNAVLNYCKLTMGYKVGQEYFRVLYLNKKNAVVGDECHEGTVDKVSIYPREILKKVLNYSATAVILVHNHPSGDTRPSQDDIDVTQIICQALKNIGVTVHDHIIVAQNQHFSFRANRLL